MSDLEVHAVTPEEMARRLQEMVGRRRENKYAVQVRMKDVDFGLDEEKAASLGVTLPFTSIEQAEQALRHGVIVPAAFLEDDETEHQVAIFTPSRWAIAALWSV